MATTTESFVRLDRVTKEFPYGKDTLQLFHDLSIELPGGTSIAITGQSGSGKTTLLHMLAGIEAPTAGSITLGEHQLYPASEHQRSSFRTKHMGLVFQHHGLLRDFTALENIMMPALIAGESKKSALARAKVLAREVGMEERLDSDPATLSGGERQRIAVARALINGPMLVLADEPTGSLDEGHSNQVAEILLSTVANRGHSLIMVTHDLAMARRCNLVYQLRGGVLEVVSP